MKKKIFNSSLGLKKTANFSKAQLLVFAVIFAGLGGYLLWSASRAATVLYIKPPTKPLEVTAEQTVFDQNGQTLDYSQSIYKHTNGIFVNGRPATNRLPPADSINVIDLDKKVVAQHTYTVEFADPSVADNNQSLAKDGIGPVARGSLTGQYQKQLQAEHAQLKGAIEKAIGKKLSDGKPQKGKRTVKDETYAAFNGMSINLTPDESAKVKKISGVKRVELATIVKANLNESIPMIHADQVWKAQDSKGLPLTGWGVKVGIIDTGVDYTHPDLGGCFGPGCKVAGGYDFYSSDNDPMDEHGHGTHVAATVAGRGIAADGTVLNGVAPDATLYAYRVLGPDGSGSSADIIAAINACLDPNGDGNLSDHLDVCTMSLGGSGNPDDMESLASDKANRCC